jgi:hypothetical protein
MDGRISIRQLLAPVLSSTFSRFLTRSSIKRPRIV